MRKSLCLLLLIGFSIILLSHCVQTDAQQADARGTNYADEHTCVKCHAKVAESYTHSAHYSTSSPATAKELQALYNTAHDTFSFPTEKVAVEKKENSFYQTSYQNGTATQSQRFDIAFGAGKQAQTFGYWKDAQVYQLPLSFFTSIPGWANSPGFPAHKANFNRAIISRCFECHASYIEKSNVQSGSLSVKEIFNTQSVMYGINCQRCHGPAQEHVVFHTDHPTEKKPMFITQWAGLSRQQKLDACAVCHSGNDQDMQRSTFSFKPGDTLADFYFPSFGNNSEPDVHGKQMQMLAASACFQKSAVLQCGSCHDPHLSENNIALFSQRCMSCHQPESDHFCKMNKTLGEAIKTNCVDCHMPEQASKLITYQKAGQDTATPYILRTHRIAIYKEETNKMLTQIKLVSIGKL